MTELLAGRRAIAGWSPRVLLAALLVLALGCWIGWATRTLLTLRDRRIVSVSLQALVQDFVASEARTPGSGDVSAARTRAYLASVDRAVSALGRDGTVVLVSEATLGRSVPDATGAVRRAIAQNGEPRDANR